MSSGELDQAIGYRKKANEVRVLASQDKNPETRKVLLQIADNYEQLARNMETVARVIQLLSAPSES
jgi:hypothetical protein